MEVKVVPNAGTDGESGTDDDFNTYSVSIGQDVSENSEVTFKKVTATDDICISSDSRLKDNVIKIDDSLSKIEKLRGVSYELKSDPGTVHIGLIAQEVNKVIPEVVQLDDNSKYYGISYQSLVPVLIEAIKELSDRIKKLENND